MLRQCLVRSVLLLLTTFLSSEALAQVVYTYDNTTTGNIPENNTACASSLVRSFTVPAADNYTVGDVAVGLDITHDTRGQLRVDLQPPGGSYQTILATSGDTSNNYTITLSANAEGAADDGDVDNFTTISYRRLVPRGTFTYSGTANGTWNLRLCDTNTSGGVGTFNSARLTLRNTSGTVTGQCASTVSFDWGSLANGSTFTSNTTLGITVSQGTTSGDATNDVWPSFITQTGVLGGHTGHYFFRMDTTGDGEPTAEYTTFTFDVPVRGLSFSLLDADLLGTGAAYEDQVKVDGFDATGGTVPKRVVLGGSQLAYAGEWAEADASVDSALTDGNVTYTFAESVSSVRIYYAQADEPDVDVGNQWIGISDLSYCAYDYGDAPTSYNVSFGANGPRHTMGTRTMYLGASRPDGESDGAGNASANADGADEDGVASWPTYVSAGTACTGYTSAAGEYCVNVTVNNTSGAGATLVGWIDFNGDGDFNDTGERSLARLRNTGGVAGADDTTFTTANIPTGTTSANRVLVWSGFGIPVNASTATYARIRLTSEPTFLSDASPQPNGAARDGEVEDYLLPAGTLPVSLAAVTSYLDRSGLVVEFSTAAEAGNIGFEIVGADGKSLAGEPLAAAEQGTLGGDYQVRLPLGKLRAFYIEDLAMDGSRKRHGPFNVGETYGAGKMQTDAIDWPAVRAKMAVRSSKAKVAASSLLLGVANAGIQRIGFADLQAAGLNLGSGIASSSLNLRDQGQAVPVYVIGGADGVFGPGDALEFVATASSNRYADRNWLVLRLDGLGASAQALPAIDQAGPMQVEGLVTVGANRLFNLSVAGAEPWLDESLLAFTTPVSLRRNVTLPGLVPLTPVSVRLKLMGGTDIATPGPDHSVIGSVNGQHRTSLKFDGVVPQQLDIDVPEGLLSNTTEFAIELPADLGLPFDLVHFDQAEIRYRRYTHLSSGRFEASFDAGSGFALSGADRRGSLWAVSNGRAWRAEFAAGQRLQVGNPAPGEMLSWVAAGDELASKPTLRAAAIAAPLPEATDFLVITHPALSAGLDDYLSLQRQRGYQPSVVTTDAIYARQEDQEPSAQAISDFIRAANAKSPLKFVTLVGADTYDYRNYLNVGSVSFVPTHYVRTSGFIAQSPSDALYADLDGDQLPDLPIGRIPARSVDELMRMVRKIKVQDGRTINRALFVAGGDSSGAKRFSDLAIDFATGLPAATQTDLVQLDEAGRDATRGTVLNAFQTGMPLISYTGHTAPGLWDFNGVLFSQDAAAFTNGGAPSLVTQWGCWNSYFVDPYAQGLSHQLLAAEGGAGTVYGATTLTDDASHTLLGRLFFEAIGAGARTVGEAELQAKRRLAELRPEAVDGQLGMQILGDPAMPIRLP